MPAISKQQNKPTKTKAPTTGGVLDRIVPVGSFETALKVCTYGRPKTGKTRFACSFPKPMLLIGTEDGTKSVKGIDFVRIHSGDELTELSEFLKQGKYKSAALDTAGGFQDIVLKEVLGIEEVPVQKSWGMTDRQTWGIVGSQFKERMRRLIDLADTHNVNIVVIAHEKNFKDDDAVGDLLLPTIGAALTPTAAGWINGACDYVCQTFIRQKMIEKSITIGDEEVTSMQPTGESEFCLRIGPHSLFQTGFRLPPGQKLPDVIVNPTHALIQRVIDGTYK